MEQFKQFSIEKQAAVDSLHKLRAVLEALGGMEIDVGDDLHKISSAIAAVESDVLRIALLGAFSDGKTSVIAAWLGNIMEDMNISMDESSDRLSIYKPKGYQASVRSWIHRDCLVTKSVKLMVNR